MASYGEVSYGEVSYGEEPDSGQFENGESSLSLTTEIEEEYTPWNVEQGDSVNIANAFDFSNGYAVFETLNVTGEVFLGTAWYYSAVAAMNFSDVQQFSQGYAVSEGLGLAENITHNVVGTQLVSEGLTLQDLGVLIFDATFADGVNFADSQAYSNAIAIAEAIELSGDANSHLQAISIVAEAIVLLAEGGVLNFENVDEAVELVSAVMTNLMAYEMHTAGINLSADIDYFVTVYIEQEELLLFDGEVSLSQLLISLIDEGVEFSVGLRLGVDVYAAWLVNTANKGVSRYENFPFNSFAEGDDGYYGAADDGIYLMRGDNDDGTNIDISIKAGLTDFGERKSKRIQDVFLGVLTSGELVMKMTADEQGVRTEYWYQVVDHGDADNHRAKVGKGLRGVYWGWELVNVDGADVDLDNVQLYPLTLSRRV